MENTIVKFFENGKVAVKLGREQLAIAQIKDITEVSVYVATFKVKSCYQRMGLGTKLMKAIIQNYHGKEAISLHVETINNTAIAFYRSLGFFVALTNNHKGFDMTGVRPHHLMTLKLENNAC